MKIVVVGSGAFGTALASMLSKNRKIEVLLISRSLSQVEEINNKHKNTEYLDGKKLSKRLVATKDLDVIKGADFVMLALPSKAILEFVSVNVDFFEKVRCVVNLSKGFGSEDGALVPDSISKVLGRKLSFASIKGPTFAHDLLLSPSSAFTIAGTTVKDVKKLKVIFKKAGLKTDDVSSIEELEYLSILKNVYAIALGVLEARYSNPNLRATVFTEALAETRIIISFFLDYEIDVLKYAGIGDILLTGLNDQSRNRTLGLMIGKSFIEPSLVGNSVVVEGVRSIKLIKDKLTVKQMQNLKIFSALVELMDMKISINQFIKRIIKS